MPESLFDEYFRELKEKLDWLKFAYTNELLKSMDLDMVQTKMISDMEKLIAFLKRERTI